MERLPASNLAHKNELGGYSESLYWQYIVDSYNNGQFLQVVSLFNKQTFHSQANCSAWLKENNYNYILDLILRHKIEAERKQAYNNNESDEFIKVA